MFLNDGANGVPSMPARTGLGAAGWFKQLSGLADGPGTVVSPEWLNMIQAELVAVLAAAGIVPNKANDAQVLAAIQYIAAAASWSAPRVSKSDAYTAVAADRGKLIAFDTAAAARTLTLLAAATAGNGWLTFVACEGANTVTIDPNGAETIEGVASFVLKNGDVALIHCDGTKWRVLTLRRSLSPGVYLGTDYVTASGTWTRPDGVLAVVVEVIGASGGGGGARQSNGGAGGGGGAGGYSRKFVDVSALSTVAVTIGAAGAAGTNGASPTAGGNGGATTSFGAHATAGSGQGGEADPNGGQVVQGGAPGTGASGDLNQPGQRGAPGVGAYNGAPGLGGFGMYGRCGGMGGWLANAPAAGVAGLIIVHKYG